MDPVLENFPVAGSNNSAEGSHSPFESKPLASRTRPIVEQRQRRIRPVGDHRADGRELERLRTEDLRGAAAGDEHASVEQPNGSADPLRIGWGGERSDGR
jgi:hypothetical protein